MAGFLPILLTGSYLALASDKLPEMNIEPGCRAAATAATALNRNEDSCKRDENEARGKLDQEWGKFTPMQQARCVSLTRLGGPPSYVELLTCLELAKQAANLPAGDRMPAKAGR